MTSALDTQVGYTVSGKQVKTGNREVNLTFLSVVQILGYQRLVSEMQVLHAYFKAVCMMSFCFAIKLMCIMYCY